LEQQFQLKEHGNLSIFEQNAMVSEDRSWWMKRLEKESRERQKREQKQSGSIPRQSMPG